jgi:transcriptional regulator
MYIPAPFAETRLDVLHAQMREHSFATVVSFGEAGLIASHLPLLLESDRGPSGTIVGHLARANPQWPELSPERDVLVMYQGPHAYVSPSWYTTPYAVPTWNYVAIHAYGRPKLIEDDAGIYRIVEATVKTHEARFSYRWSLDERREFAEKLLKQIVGFEIEITRLEGKFKLGQNRSRADQNRVVEALTQQGDSLSGALAEVMRGRLGA